MERKKLVVAFLFVVIIIGFFLFSSLFGRQVTLSQKTTKTSAAPVGVIGGEEVNISKWPFMVALFYKGSLQWECNDQTGICNPRLNELRNCTGTLINEQWVLTAAHCIQPPNPIGGSVSPKNFGVAMGFDDLSEKVTLMQIEERFRNVVDVLIHESYPSSPTIKYLGSEVILPVGDIALLKLDRPFAGIPTVSLNGNMNLEKERAPAIILGWGATQSGGYSVKRLHEALIPLVSNARSNKVNWYNGVVTDPMMTAGFLSGGGNVCKGDSGGPLLIWDGAKWVQAGIASSSPDCEKAHLPGIFTNVRYFTDWITDKTSIKENALNGNFPFPIFQTVKEVGIQPGSGTFTGNFPEIDSPQFLNYIKRLHEFEDNDRLVPDPLATPIIVK